MIEEFNSMINGVFTWGDGDSDYTDLISITREYIRRITHFSRTLNKIGSPHLIIDQSTLAQMQQTGVGEAEYDSRGMIFPVATGTQKPEWLAFDAQQDAMKQQIERMLTAWHSATGSPPVLFHPQVAHSSGVSIERQLQMFIRRIQRWQREIEELVPQVAQAMGLPVMPVEFPDNLASFRETEMDVYAEEDARQGAMDART